MEHKCSASTAVTKFITNKMCPFAQKAWIALECSQTPYELKEVSLYGAGGKPDWFWKLNPKGTVPVLVCSGGAVVYADSDHILDAFEKNSTGIPMNKPLYPGDKEEHKKISSWRNRVNEMLPIGKKAILSGNTANLKILLREMDKEVEGPFLTGELVTTADCHAFPFFWRLEQEVGLGESSPNLSKWLQLCSDDPAFHRTIQSAWWWWW